jgi:hypothetical protein
LGTSAPAGCSHRFKRLRLARPQGLAWCDELQTVVMNKAAGIPVVQRCGRCGNEFEYLHTRGKYRKWCSRRCAKAPRHAHQCAACGRPTIRRTDKEPDAPQLCRSCADLRSKHRVEELWARGLTSREIATEMGFRAAQPHILISMWRARGYDLPYRRPEMAVVGQTSAKRWR